MAKVLPFTKRQPPPDVALPPPDVAPATKTAMTEKLLENASQDLTERHRRGDLRKASLVRCECGYQFYAPVVNRCPKCRSENLTLLLEQELDYTRV